MKPNHYQLVNLTRERVLELAPRALLLLTTAAVEQHGPHLPLGTDTFIGQAVTQAVLEELDTDEPVVAAPVLPYGSSHHHLPYSALSIATANYLGALNDLFDSAVASGFRRLFVINSHGGNAECLRLAGRDRALAQPVAIGTANYWDLARNAIKRGSLGYTGPIPGHAGQFETSLMLHIKPDTVHLDALPLERLDPGIENRQVDSQGAQIHSHGEWTRIDGFTDLPIEPTPELGRALLQVIGSRVAAAVNEFLRLTDQQATEEA